MTLPTFADVLAARRVLADYLPVTPARRYSLLDAATGAAVVVKHENTLPTCAFKVRGGINLLAGMQASDRQRGIMGYSTGNHAQSLAYAAAQFGVRCAIVMPEGANRGKVAAVQALGAEVVEHGVNFDQARKRAEKLAADRQMRLVSSANEPEIVAGVATAYLELFEVEPDIDVVIVPTGGGSGAAAACLVAAELAPRCQVVAVQSSASPAAHDSWRAGTLVERPNQSVVEGIATGAGFELTQQIMREHLTDFLLVDDDEIAQAQMALMCHAHTLAEGAGAAGLAALLAHPDRFAGRTIAIVCTGANASESEIRRVVSATPALH